MLQKDLVVEETYYICPSATELHNVSTSEDGMYIRYCGNSVIYNHCNINYKYFLLIIKLNKKQIQEKNLINQTRLVDFTDIDSTITTTKSTTEPTHMSTSDSPTIQTEVSLTGNNFNISQSTSLVMEVLPTDENVDISHSTTLRTEVSSTNQSSRVNSSQITTITSLSGEKDLKVKSSKHLYNSLLTKQV